jgi:hypothetical protein
MPHKLFLPLMLASVSWAQAPPDLKSRLTGLQPIEIKEGLTRIANAEGDGRDAQVFCAWRDNGNAWGFHVYMVTMPRKFEGGAGTDWWIVGMERDPNGAPAFNITDTPHTGEDAITTVRFARGQLDGKPSTLLITAERQWKNSVPDPAVAAIRVYVLKNNEDEGPGTTPDAFEPALSFTTTATYSDANAALKAELGL